MDYYFITGTNKGLGKALTTLLLKNDNNVVFGISRKHTIKHQSYNPLTLDLNDLEAVKVFNFPTIAPANKVILINNAGVIGAIKHLGNQNEEAIITTYNVNLISPTLLINKLLKTYDDAVIKQIVNISSGAGRTPIDGWSVYCSTKAGLDMMSLVLKEECSINHKNISVLSLAPGIIDTAMQESIRKAQPEDFSNIERFKTYKRQGDLATPENTAQLVLQFLENEKMQENTICSVRDIQ